MPNDQSLAPKALKDALLHHLMFSVGKDDSHATTQDWRMALSFALRDRIVAHWFEATRATYKAEAKRVYYLSMEFLIGRLLEDGLVNLGLMDQAVDALEAIGLDARSVIADEPDAALGNGGLGRLAACFLESLSTLGIPAYGYGIRYEHGLFEQQFSPAGRQLEFPERWLEQPHPWEFERPEAAYPIMFGGSVWEKNKRKIWMPEQVISAAAYDTPIVGWQGRWANTLRLWSGRAVDGGFDLARFNAGDYVSATSPEAEARTISRVLYPDDSTEIGKELRLKQEYFFTAASLADILRRFDSEYGDIKLLPQKAAVQLNDTHPAIAGPELVRLLHDDRGMAFDDAVAAAQEVLGYTNHTLLPEALERWPEDLFGRLLPRHLEIIDRIDNAHAKAHPDRKVTIREPGTVKMGELSFVMAHRVNGVSALHTGLMKTTVFKELDRLHPGRIVNQTNGVTPRRWLKSCNPGLAGLITDTIGDGWEADLERLVELEPHIGDSGFDDAYAGVKKANKDALSNWISQTHGITLDPAAMFDVHIKRMHEYKRQHLNILEAIALWQEIRDNPAAGWTKRVKLFAGKAAPAYVFAKDIIALINDVARVLNADPVTNRYLQVVFLPNYNVTLAERMIPASDLSEQISTAGKEASGTGNMKFALNGALTIGTLDGANVEIRERVGAENFFLFGMTADEVEARRAVEAHAAKAVAADPRLARALEAVRDGTFSAAGADQYAHIADNIAGHDYFTVASDFTDYWRAQRAVDAVFADPKRWMRMAALNTARSGWFSSDRTILGYARDVWGTKPLI